MNETHTVHTQFVLPKFVRMVLDFRTDNLAVDKSSLCLFACFFFCWGIFTTDWNHLQVNRNWEGLLSTCVPWMFWYVWVPDWICDFHRMCVCFFFECSSDWKIFVDRSLYDRCFKNMAGYSTAWSNADGKSVRLKEKLEKQSTEVWSILSACVTISS